MWQKIIHDYLRQPYTLHTEVFSTPKDPVATIVFVHGIGSSAAMWQPLIKKVRHNATIIALDLVGFGRSPKPQGETYDAVFQARCIHKTLKGIRYTTPVIFVGHSLGTLIAVEYAKLYPHEVDSLVLCSPPFYMENSDQPLSIDEGLIKVYQQVIKHPKDTSRILSWATKYYFPNKGFHVDKSHVGSYIQTLQSAIINQTALRDAKQLPQRIRFFVGKFDPLVVTANIVEVVRDNIHASITRVAAGHEITGVYTITLARAIDAAVAELTD